MMGRRVVIGAVAQSARSARQESSNRTTEQREASLSSGGGTFSNGDSADVLKAQIIEMERIRNEKSKAFRNINDITSTDLNDSERSLLKSTLLKGFISVLQGRIEIKYSYLKLLAIITFFCFYSISVILQRDISSSFGVQSSAIFTKILASLPAPSGGRVGMPTWIGDGSTPLASSYINSKDDITTWLGESIFPLLFQDSVCGDGKCDDDENLGIGRFGCDLHKAFIFESHSNKTLQKVVVDKKDNITLHLFQTWSFESSTDLDESDIYQLTGFVASTIPDRNPVANDFAYGDRREVLSTASWQASSWGDFCKITKSVGGSVSGGPSDDNCKNSVLAPNYYGSSILSTAQLLTTYGLKGDISVRKNVMTAATGSQMGGGSSPEMQLISLIKGCKQGDVGCFPGIPYCSIAPDLSQLSAKLVNATMMCASSVRRDIQSSGRAERHSSSLVHIDILQRSSGFSSISFRKSSLDLLASNEGRSMFRAGSLRKAGGEYNSEKELATWSTREHTANAQLVPVFVGDPNGECWWCHERNSSTGDCSGHSERGGAILNFMDCMFLRFGGFALLSPVQQGNLALAQEYEAPSFAVLDISACCPRRLSVTIDNSEPTCEGEYGSEPPKVALLVPYMGKTRLVISPSFAPEHFRGSSLDIQIVKAKMCSLNQTGTYSSTLSLKLVPGPSVRFVFNISKDLDSVRVEKLKTRFCSILWPEDYYHDQHERCSFQLFLRVTLLQVTMTVLLQSNGHATRARLLINEEFLKSELIAELSVVWSADSASVHAPSTFGLGKSETWGVQAKLDMSATHGCFSHEDCEDGMFCSMNARRDPRTFAGWFGCDPCTYCVRDSDAADGACPRDRCRDQLKIPACLNAALFLRDFECKSKYQLNMSIVRDTDAISPDLSNQSPTGRDIKAKTKARFLTPFNRLIGAVMITQERSSTATKCTMQNQHVQNFSDSGSGTICRSNALDSSPFGVDPAFSISSTLYAGDLAPEEWYAKSERSQGKDGGLGAPYGFFSTSHVGRDFMNGSQGAAELPESATSVAGSGDRFRLYFDERIQGAHAQNLLTYIIDGGFLDDKTRKVTVEMSTLNVQLNIMATFAFIFQFQEDGKIKWDYSISSVPVDLYSKDSDWRNIIEIICIIFLVVNCCLELKDIFRSVQNFVLFHYLTDIWNVVDWTHFILMSVGWVNWLGIIRESNSFHMESSYHILSSPGTETRARLFEVDPNQESKFLAFSSNLKNLSRNLRNYVNLTTICDDIFFLTIVILFILRSLKAFNFQPKMALVTRTISNTSSDLAHFIILFIFVLFGYSIAGYLQFGEEHEGFSNFENSILSLFFTLIALDPPSLFTHKSGQSEWAFHIFFWSWLCLAFFVLLNILLAILVEGYMQVKSQSEDKNEQDISIAAEISEILSHEAKRFSKVLWPQSSFLSDEEILFVLKGQLKELSSTFGKKLRAVQDYESITFSSNGLAIKLDGGMQMNRNTLYFLLFGDKQESNPFLDHSPLGRIHDNTAESSAQMYLSSCITDVLLRFGKICQPTDLSRATMELLQLDTMRRFTHDRLASLQAQPDSMKVLDCEIQKEIVVNDNAPAIWVKTYTISVEIQKARNLPKMDLFRGVDAFCAVFLEGTALVYQTEIKRGYSEKQWDWGSEGPFEFDIDESVYSPALSQHKLIAMVYDKDQISNDDLIGCACLKFTDLNEGHFEGWIEIIVPFTTAKKSRISKFSTQKSPELKLKVNVSRKMINFSRLEGSGAELVLPSAHLDYSSRIEAQLHGDC